MKRIVLAFTVAAIFTVGAFACKNVCNLDSQGCGIECVYDPHGPNSSCEVFDCTCYFESCSGGALQTDGALKNAAWTQGPKRQTCNELTPTDYRATAGARLMKLTLRDAPLNLKRMAFDGRTFALSGEVANSTARRVVKYRVGVAAGLPSSGITIRNTRFHNVSSGSTERFDFESMRLPSTNTKAKGKVILIYIAEVVFADGSSWKADRKELEMAVNKLHQEAKVGANKG